MLHEIVKAAWKKFLAVSLGVVFVFTVPWIVSDNGTFSFYLAGFGWAMGMNLIFSVIVGAIVAIRNSRSHAH